MDHARECRSCLEVVVGSLALSGGTVRESLQQSQHHGAGSMQEVGELSRPIFVNHLTNVCLSTWTWRSEKERDGVLLVLSGD